MIKLETNSEMRVIVFVLAASLCVSACAPQVMRMEPLEGRPGTIVSLSMEYLVGWPRVEISGKTLDYYQVKLLGLKPDRRDVSDMELVWIEDKVLEFRVPDLPPGEYQVTVHDDKGPPGDTAYSLLQTTAYLVFPPVWPFVLRSNEASLTFRIIAE